MQRALFGIPGLALVAATIMGAVPSPKAAKLDPEVFRLQQHFATVDAALRTRDVSHLSAEQLAARLRNLEVLRAYAQVGVFPHNHDFVKQVPYFRDQHGTLCAMAYLIARSGRPDLVDKVARSANNAYLPALARDPALLAWLNSNGLTVAEAAWIQPAYGPIPGEPQADEDRGYQIATVGASLISGGAITWTLLSNPQRSGYLPGVVTTVVGLGDLLIAAGGALNETNDAPGNSISYGSLPTLNAVVGVITTVAGIGYVVRAANKRGERSAPASAASPSRFQNWQPVLYNDANGRTRIGAHLRF